MVPLSLFKESDKVTANSEVLKMRKMRALVHERTRFRHTKHRADLLNALFVPNSDTIVPSKLLSLRSKDSSAKSRPISLGIDPPIEFWLSKMWVKESMLPIAEGSVPLMKLDSSSKWSGRRKGKKQG